VIPEIDIRRAAQLMLKRDSNRALEESMVRAPTSLDADDATGCTMMTWTATRFPLAADR